MPYQAFYQYMPVKRPSLLGNEIDPFDISSETLRHQKYPNITIVGNNVKLSPYSFYGMNIRANVMINNICYSLLNSRKVSLY